MNAFGLEASIEIINFSLSLNPNALKTVMGRRTAKEFPCRVIFAFKSSLASFLIASSCSTASVSRYSSPHAHRHPATTAPQRNVAYALAGLVALAGLYFAFLKKDEPLVAGEKRKTKDLSKLEGDEKTVASYVQEAGGSLYQSDLVAKTGFTKVRVTRILDKLEHDGVVERKRRGMTNIVVLR